MANYSDARWGAFRYKLNEMMQKPEFKRKPSPALMKYLKSTDFLVPASEKERILGVKQSDQDTVYVNLLNKQATTSASARAAAHTGSINDSTREELSFATYAQKFKYSMKGADRTIFSLAEQVSAQLLSAAIALHSDIETALLANLGTNKSQVVTSETPRSGDWDATNYIFGVANTDYDLFIQKITGFMREQYYKGVMLEAILDETLWQKATYLANQRVGNNVNTEFQFGGVNFGDEATQELALSDGYVGNGYIFQMGGVGLIPWIPQLNRQGFGEAGMNGGYYGSIPDPLGSGLTFAVHEYYTGADNESLAGETQDVDVQVELSIDLAPLVAPQSTANASNVYLFGVKQ